MDGGDGDSPPSGKSDTKRLRSMELISQFQFSPAGWVEGKPAQQTAALCAKSLEALGVSSIKDQWPTTDLADFWSSK